MNRVRQPLAAVLCLALLGPLSAAQADPPAGEIDRLARQLGAPPSPKREEAARRLTDQGEPALPALRSAMKSPDPEVRRRAAAIYRRLTDLSPEERAAVAAAAATAF